MIDAVEFTPQSRPRLFLLAAAEDGVVAPVVGHLAAHWMTPVLAAPPRT